MKTGSIGILGAASLATAASSLPAASAAAEVIGLTAAVRLPPNSTCLVNAFACAGSASPRRIRGDQGGSQSCPPLGGFLAEGGGRNRRHVGAATAANLTPGAIALIPATSVAGGRRPLA